MFETSRDLQTLQALIDASYAVAGPHLQRIHDPGRRLTAQQVSQQLQGMCLLTLATVTADHRPITGPVDGIFYRGSFYFGSSADSLRFKHIRRNPHVSATHLPGEQLAITVHGTATQIDIRHPDHAGFRQALLDIYLPRYGPEWETDFLDAKTAGAPAYARIDAARMFTFSMPEAAGPDA